MKHFTVKRLKQMSQWSIFIFFSVLVFGLITAVVNIFVGAVIIVLSFSVMELGAMCEERADKKLAEDEESEAPFTR